MKTKSSPLAALVAFALVVSASAQTDFEKAAAALKSGDLATAETLVAPLAAAEPASAPALHLLSQVRLRQQRSKEAIELAERATKADPAKADYFSHLGIAVSSRMGEVGFMQQAILSVKMKGAFEKSIELDPQHVAGLIGLARYYSNAPEIAGGSLTKAREFAVRVHALHPFLGAVELGRIAEKAENYPEALQHYEAALAVRPEAAGVQVSAGRVLAQLGRKDDARRHFEAALTIDPKLESARKALASLDGTTAAN